VTNGVEPGATDGTGVDTLSELWAITTVGGAAGMTTWESVGLEARTSTAAGTGGGESIDTSSGRGEREPILENPVADLIGKQRKQRRNKVLR
jgi:hypothetical protein